ncbi:MAG: ATP synthase F1 subunit gamma [Cryomorphaceae bacterium]|nr:MAG: ATP synthase F1 subunit gamma [Cryomorphaceae bacterium]|tara:strand:+ start:764 stop:1624 length:861 start_codon:yes stop_codon:yes gene_type:complete
MPNLKEIRNRITSVTSTMKITSAMKMVSAAKLKKAQDAVTAMRPYSEKLGELMSSFYDIISSSSVSQLSESRDIKNVLIIPICSNKGLCGAFNSNVVKKAISLKNQSNFSKANFSFLIIGKKANDIISKTENVISNHSSIFENINYDNAASIVDNIIELFTNGEYDHVELIYNTFKNAANQTTISEQFLPITAPEDSEVLSDYIFEPSMEKIVLDLVPKSLKIQLFKAIRDSFAGEHGARMTAMHKATDNASELKSELVLTYNKARQAAITNEILEIVSGAEALNG